MELKRTFIFILLSLLTSSIGYGQTELENIIISNLLNKSNKLIPENKTHNHHKIHEIIISTVTKNPVHEAEFDTLSMFKWKVLKNKDREMLHDFCEKNRKCLRIDTIKELNKNITFVDDSRIKKILTRKNGWNVYHASYGLKPYVNISRPGFNRKRNKALIYLTYAFGKDDGAGYYLVMKKAWGKWKIKGPMLVWIL